MNRKGLSHLLPDRDPFCRFQHLRLGMTAMGDPGGGILTHYAGPMHLGACSLDVAGTTRRRLCVWPRDPGRRGSGIRGDLSAGVYSGRDRPRTRLPSHRDSSILRAKVACARLPGECTRLRY